MISRFVIAFTFALLAACSSEETDTLTGYVEAELIYLAPQDAGVIETLSVREGDRVKAGDLIFALDPSRAGFAADQATALAQGVAAQIADDGAMEQQIIEAQSALVLAKKTFERSQSLVVGGAVSREKYDIDAASLAAAEARLERLRAERAAMQSELTAAEASAQLAKQRMLDLETHAPADGSIERIYRRPGEVARAGDPVVALLPPQNLKLKFFAPETMLSSLALGDQLSFSCDGCASVLTGKISFIASEPQFTPPLIYSLKERKKLVFLVEARPDDPLALRPGLPVTIIAP